MIPQKAIKNKRLCIATPELIKICVMSKMLSDIISLKTSSADGVLGLMNITGNYYDVKVSKFKAITKIRQPRSNITEKAWKRLGRDIKLTRAKIDAMAINIK